MTLAISLTVLHMIDSILSLVHPLGDLMIFEAKATTKNVNGWRFFLMISRIIRNQIDIVTGFSFLVLAYTIGIRLIESKKIEQ